MATTQLEAQNPSPAGEGRVRGKLKHAKFMFNTPLPNPLHQERGQALSNLRIFEFTE